MHFHFQTPFFLFIQQYTAVAQESNYGPWLNLGTGRWMFLSRWKLGFIIRQLQLIALLPNNTQPFINSPWQRLKKVIMGPKYKIRGFPLLYIYPFDRCFHPKRLKSECMFPWDWTHNLCIAYSTIRTTGTLNEPISMWNEFLLQKSLSCIGCYIIGMFSTFKTCRKHEFGFYPYFPKAGIVPYFTPISLCDDVGCRPW